jgi:NhaA family Na+:H+ antiporter
MSTKLRWATPPPDLTWGSLFGAAWLCGIGFTMCLFIATLAFGDGPLLNMAKMGVLGASLASGLCASLFLLGQNASTLGSRAAYEKASTGKTGPTERAA